MSESQNLSVLILWLDGHPGVVQFVFRDIERADAALDEVEQRMGQGGIAHIQDSYGRKLVVVAAKIVAAQVTDCAAELTGQADLAILQAHANTKLQKRAQQDPMLSGRPMIVPAHQGGAPGPLPFQR